MEERQVHVVRAKTEADKGATPKRASSNSAPLSDCVKFSRLSAPQLHKVVWV